MDAFEVATKFFHACEGLAGWEGCKNYVAHNAEFTAQCEPLVDMTMVQEYCEWMAGVGNGPLVACSYELHSSAYDECNSTAIFFGTFSGKHTAEGGPVPPTNQKTHTHYVYTVEIDSHNKVKKMTKIWNAPWALKELGWA